MGGAITGLRTGYIDKEKDRETSLGDHGSRKYETETGRFTSVDRLFEKYPNVSSYSYGANNPLTMVDPGGDSIIVLLDRDGAMGFGHAAVLIGNEVDGWGLYSKNGGDIANIAGKSVKYQIGKDGDHFKNLADFRSSKKSDRYTGALLFRTDYKTDAKAKQAAIKKIKEDFKLMSNSCIDVASRALEVAGYVPGRLTVSADKIGYVESPVPNTRYEDIKRENKIYYYGVRDVTKEALKGEKHED